MQKFKKRPTLFKSNFNSSLILYFDTDQFGGLSIKFVNCIYEVKLYYKTLVYLFRFSNVFEEGSPR